MRARTTVRILAALGAGTLGLGLGTTLPAHGGLTTICEGVAADVTVPNDLVVPKDSSCDLTSVVIEGDVVLRVGANLTTEDVTITGGLTAGEDSYADLVGTSVGGDLVLAKSYGVFTSDGAVGGDTIARQPGFLYSEESDHRGDVRSSGGTTYLEGAVVEGRVATTEDLVSDLDDTWIKGNLTIRDAELGSVICASEVDGNGVLTGNGGTLQLGLDASGDACASTYVGGNLRVSGNTADAVISNAIIRGNLNCVDNDPAPVGANNRVRGHALNQCENLSAPGTSSRSFRDVTATKVDVSKRETLSKIERRRVAAQEQAVELGAADLG